MPPHENLEGPDRPQTWLVIPYFDNDVGHPDLQRPLSTHGVVPYLCPAIIVDGKRGDFSLRRGVDLGIQVEVANCGHGSMRAVAEVSLFWANPTVGFAKVNPFHLDGGSNRATLIVPPTRQRMLSPPIRGQIPLSAPRHVCLLARVSSPSDRVVAGPANPHGDRHWAQTNLTEVAAKPDGSFIVKFSVANPLVQAARSKVSLDALSEAETSFVSNLVAQDVTSSRVVVTELRHEGGPSADGAVVQPGESVSLELHAQLMEEIRDAFLTIRSDLFLEHEEGEIPHHTGHLGVRVVRGD
jgi:hypothetical protein